MIKIGSLSNSYDTKRLPARGTRIFETLVRCRVLWSLAARLRFLVFRSCGCSLLQLADQAGYGFWRANEGISVEELPAPEQIPVYFSKRRFVANSRPSRLHGLDL